MENPMVNWGAARELAETASAIVKDLRAPDEALSGELLAPGPAKLAHSAAETLGSQRIDAAVSPKAPAQDSRAFFLSSGDTPKKPGIFGDSPASPAVVSRDTIPVLLTEGNLTTLARNMYRETRTWENLVGAHQQASYGDKYLKGTWDYLLHPGTSIPFDVVQDATKASQVRDTLSHIPQIIPTIDRFRGELSYVRQGLSQLQQESADRLEVAGSIWNPFSKSIGLPQVELKRLLRRRDENRNDGIAGTVGRASREDLYQPFSGCQVYRCPSGKTTIARRGRPRQSNDRGDSSNVQRQRHCES
jgi:hypothetical protein